MTVSIRPVSPADLEPLVELLAADRDFQKPWHRTRDPAYFTLESQRLEITRDRAQHDAGVALPYVILDDGHLAGRITVSNIARGVFQSGDLGYWVTESRNGRGVATNAVAAIVAVAFKEMRLHRLQAATLLPNLGSQRVLRRNGFEPIGVAPGYLQIAGRWQDHLLFQRINEAFA